LVRAEEVEAALARGLPAADPLVVPVATGEVVVSGSAAVAVAAAGTRTELDLSVLETGIEVERVAADDEDDFLPAVAVGMVSQPI
jgi:hypothetical protein